MKKFFWKCRYFFLEKKLNRFWELPEMLTKYFWMVLKKVFNFQRIVLKILMASIRLLTYYRLIFLLIWISMNFLNITPLLLLLIFFQLAFKNSFQKKFYSNRPMYQLIFIELTLRLLKKWYSKSWKSSLNNYFCYKL